jgi:hypothetical protein
VLGRFTSSEEHLIGEAEETIGDGGSQDEIEEADDGVVANVVDEDNGVVISIGSVRVKVVKEANSLINALIDGVLTEEGAQRSDDGDPHVREILSNADAAAELRVLDISEVKGSNNELNA